jgi:hypothetical protein
MRREGDVTWAWDATTDLVRRDVPEGALIFTASMYFLT